MSSAAPAGVADLRPLLEARSVAVVGASVRSASLGEAMMIELTRGFDGEIYPVNPKYEEMFDRRCYPSLAELPEPPDLVILGVATGRQEEQLRYAAEAGARSAVIFSSLYEAPAEGVTPLPQRMAAIARAAGMVICGANGMGFLNVEKRLRATGFAMPPEMEPGPIAFISHSGSAFSAMAWNHRVLKFNVLISAGQELTTTAADYLRYALSLESTTVVGMLIETVRDAASFRAGLETAAERDIPILALKVGRTAVSKRLVTAHSGALAGEDGAYEAVFDAYGVHRVQTLDEMADAMELFVSGRRAPSGGLASVHDSGGERAMFIDAAADAGVRFADLSEESTKRLEDALEEGLEPVNPLDAWGTGIGADEIFLGGMEALLSDDDTAALAFVVDLTKEEDSDGGYLGIARTTFQKTDKPFMVLSNMAAAVDPDDAASLRADGVPLLEGTDSGLAAIRHLFDHRDFRVRGASEPPAGPGEEVRSRWRDRLASGEGMSELEALRLLSDYGVPVVKAEGAEGEVEATRAAHRLRWPVAVKTVAPGIQHKSDADGVRLNVGTPEQMKAVLRDFTHRLGSSEVVVAEMSASGVELALGVVRDAQFGPLVLVAAGGVLVEILADRRLALPPLDVSRARMLLDRLAIRPLLDGVRGALAADVDAVANAIAALSVLAAELGDLLDAVDVNPLIAGPEGCVAVDALVIPRTQA
ncbi:MAG: acetate--CoA ligase family protein [Actinomycetota bacterium]